jgi:hypothetical protein
MHLRRLRPVFETTGPYTTVHVEVGRAGEDAEDRADARWTRIRHDLERAGTDQVLVDNIETRVRADTHLPGEVWRTIVATPSAVVLDDAQAGHNPHGEVLDHGALPELTAWLEHEDQALPFVLAVVDRAGADLAAYRALGARPADQEQVTGETYYVTKVASGDWAQKEFQQTAENSWQHNARLVADSIRVLAAQHASRALFVVGEVRARAELRHALDAGEHEHLGPVVEIEAGGRGKGASDEAMWAEIRTRVRECVADDDADVTARLEEGRGRGQGVAAGLDEVLDALGKAQVSRLVVDLDGLAERTVDVAGHPGLALPSTAQPGEELPAARVLVSATALTDASITLLPASMVGSDGVAALLRWSD